MLRSLFPFSCLIAIVIVLEGCDRFSSQPQLNTRTEAVVMERFFSAPPGEVENPWQELEAMLGESETIPFTKFLNVTGYNIQEPQGVECRIWRNSRGEWLAIAYHPESKCVSAIKSYMRR